MMENKPEIYKPTEKLILDQTNKQNFLYTVYQLKQSPWPAKCSKYKTEQRLKAKTEFTKFFYGLMNFSFYEKGKTNF